MKYLGRRKFLLFWLVLVGTGPLAINAQTAEQLIRQAAAQTQPLRMAEAEILLLQAREKDPDNPQAAIFLGHLYLLRGAVQAALECFDSTLQSHPDDAAARYGRSLSLGYLGQPAQAAEELEKLLPREWLPPANIGHPLSPEHKK